MPTRAENRTAIATAPTLTTVFQLARREMMADAVIPSTIPTQPPAIESVTASVSVVNLDQSLCLDGFQIVAQVLDALPHGRFVIVIKVLEYRAPNRHI